MGVHIGVYHSDVYALILSEIPLVSVSVFIAAFKNIDDTLWKDAGCGSELDYIEQTSWILFLKYLDDYEADKANSALLNGEVYNSILSVEFSWNTWAAPKSADGKLDYNAALTGIERNLR